MKLFAPGGRKLPDDRSSARRSGAARAARRRHRAAGRRRRRRRTTAGSTARSTSTSSTSSARSRGATSTGSTVVLDCGNGAAFRHRAAQRFAQLGADVDGHQRPARRHEHQRRLRLDRLRRAPGGGARRRRDAGLAFDGDADRVIAVDERGGSSTATRSSPSLALDLHDRGRLAGRRDRRHRDVEPRAPPRARASTTSTLVETPVGDRTCSPRSRSTTSSLGGEQSGHVIFARPRHHRRRHAHRRAAARRSCAHVSKPLSELAGVVQRRSRRCCATSRSPTAAGSKNDRRFMDASCGRRGGARRRRAGARAPSGTEPVVRVMVEAPTQEQAEAVGESPRHRRRAGLRRRRLTPTSDQRLVDRGLIGERSLEPGDLAVLHREGEGLLDDRSHFPSRLPVWRCLATTPSSPLGAAAPSSGALNVPPLSSPSLPYSWKHASRPSYSPESWLLPGNDVDGVVRRRSPPVRPCPRC